MNYLRKFNESKEEDIAKICKEFGIENWSIRDGLVDVDGDVFIYNKNLHRLPLNFGFINGRFDCSDNNLVTLEGAPIEVNGFFDCDGNQLTTLEGCPKKIKYSLFCSKNKLTNLIGSPDFLEQDLFCNFNNLTNLEGSPKKIVGDLHCAYNNLISLEGSPMNLGGRLNCLYNPIFEIWKLFMDKNQIDFFNDLDIVRDPIYGKPTFILDRLNFFLETIGKEPVTGISGWISMD